MSPRGIALILALLGAAPLAAADKVVIVVHGGAGTMPRAEMTAEREQAIREALEQALTTGYAILTRGGSALDAVTAAVALLEDSPHFNAGKGAVFSAEGKNELDASIMDGATRRAGAVAGVHRVRNPVRLARAVMEHSPHVMLVGDGAEAFAREVGVDLVSPRYFRTDRRWQELQRAREREREAAADQASAARAPDAYFGTVGAVALDREGRLAAATSTGGMTNKRWGRIGDSPVIGAGTWADARCAVSGTGWGEYFLRAAAAHDVCARMAYRDLPLAAAATEVIEQEIAAPGGNGGVIALDAEGNVAMPFSTEGMYRGVVDAEGKLSVAIYRDSEQP